MPEKKPAVFDASVLVGLLDGRTAVVRAMGPVVDSVLNGLRRGVISFVNAAEVQYVAEELLAKLGQDVFGFLRHARIDVAGVNKAQVLAAAEAKRKVPDLSLGDAFAFALARRRGGRLFTTDPAFDHAWVRDRIAVTHISR